MSGTRNRLPRLDAFESVGAWYQYVQAEGFAVPVQTPFAVSRLVDEGGLDPQEAYDHLRSIGLLVETGVAVVVDLVATRLPVDEILERT